MFNIYFYIALVLGFALRTYDGKVISIAVGLCAGILLCELWKFGVWLFR